MQNESALPVLVGEPALPSPDAGALHAAEQTASAGYANPALLVTAPQVADHLSDSSWRIVDVRSREQYAAGHIPGTVNLSHAAQWQHVQKQRDV